MVMARFELFRNLDRQCKVAKGKLGLVFFKAFKMQDGRVRFLTGFLDVNYVSDDRTRMKSPAVLVLCRKFLKCKRVSWSEYGLL